jgi:uncharacterized DUF497 family protein
MRIYVKIEMEMNFFWNRSNVEHIGKHGISTLQAEYIVENASPPYPRMIGESKRIVIGKLANGEYLQVIYVPSRVIKDAVYVIHARPLTKDEKKHFRRRMR